MQNRVLVVGRGAIGAAVAVCAEDAGFNVLSRGRTEHLGPWEGSLNGKVFSLREWHQLEPIDICFLAVKAFDLKGAGEVAGVLPVGTPIVSLANGFIVSELEHLRLRYPRHLWRLGSVTLGVSNTGYNQFEIRSKGGAIKFGKFQTKDLDPTDIETRIFDWDRAMRGFHQKKWLFNTVINSLVVTLNLTKNGDLLNYRETVTKTFGEAYRAGSDLLGGWTESQEQIMGELFELIEQTALNENSMLKDIKSKRPTETNYLAGVVEQKKGDYPILWELHTKILARSLP